MIETLHIYTRVSSATQEEDGTSLETQKELGITCAEKNGFNYKIWNEGAQSWDYNTEVEKTETPPE